MNDAASTVRPFRARAWATLSEAVRGSHRDFTEGPIGPAIVILAIPMVMEMIMESVFAVADIFWVSKLGADSAPWVAKTENCFSTLALEQSGHFGVSPFRTSSSKCDSQLMQTYS